MKRLIKKWNPRRSYNSIRQPSRFREECLKAHNKYRSIHGSPDLLLDKEITSYAQEWANSLADRCVFDRRPNCRYGENLFTAVETDPEWFLRPSDPVISWYAEIVSYTFDEDGVFKDWESSRFTQVIWKDTSRLGVGVSTDHSSRVYVVCDYDPAGNTVGQFAENVLPPAKVAKHKNTVGYSRGQRRESRGE